jgi:hypothetical protein
MVTYLHRIPKRLALVVILLSTRLLVFGAEEDFAKVAKQTLSENHARAFQEGNIKGCVSIYADDAKFFVDNKLIARGETELLEFYKGLREVDRIRKIVIDEFVDIGSRQDFGWAIFNYTKEFDLKNRDPQFIKTHKLEGFSTLNVKQYGTAIFVKIDGRWKIQTMTVFDPEIWEPKKK